MPTRAEFLAELMSRLRDGERRGVQYMEVNSGEMHRSLGGYPGASHRMPVCCDAMYAERTASDEIVSRPPKGKGASLTIRYKLPRTHVRKAI